MEWTKERYGSINGQFLVIWRRTSASKRTVLKDTGEFLFIHPACCPLSPLEGEGQTKVPLCCYPKADPDIVQWRLMQTISDTISIWTHNTSEDASNSKSLKHCMVYCSHQVLMMLDIWLQWPFRELLQQKYMGRKVSEAAERKLDRLLGKLEGLGDPQKEMVWKA